MSDAPAQVWMDQGGTFTDIVRVEADGRVSTRKVLSDQVDLDAQTAAAVDVRRGTTVATNALLERRGVPVLLLTTAGFGDAPWIGEQVRPALFALHIERAAPLCVGVVEVQGRLGIGPGEGPVTVLEPHSVDSAELARHVAAGVRSAAVVLVHGPLAPDEERRLGNACRAAGFEHVSLGHEVAPSRGFLARLHTTLADAALTPLLPRARGRYMKSDGGLADATSPAWRGAAAVLSGPAGGVVACEVLARSADVGPVFGLDMGGTSTDVCRVDGTPDRVDHLEIAGVRLRVPAVRVETVAAGGGSVLGRSGGVFVAGPGSAGADPGPACYGRGGPACITDCEAVLGRLPGFPAVAGPRRDQPLDLAAAGRALQAVGPGLPVEQVAAGCERVAVETMARAVRSLAANRGVDPARHALIAFGGAGPGHGCAVARALGIGVVLVPHLAGVFSAVGIGLARRQQEVVAPLVTDIGSAIASARERLTDLGEGLALELFLAVRHVGVNELLEVSISDLLDEPELGSGATDCLPDAVLERFFDAQRLRFGFDRPGHAVEAVEVRIRASEQQLATGLPGHLPLAALDDDHVHAWFEGWQDVPLRRPQDAHGLMGPAVILASDSTIIVPPGWQVSLCDDHLRLTDRGAPPATLGTAFHPVHTAVFGTRVMAVADQMGQRLARLARSVSMRERRDFSCAVFDARGGLVANAPHVPVHLGAMGATVRDLMHRRSDQVTDGTAWASNDPYAGGSHLPDITVTVPVFVHGRRVAFVACRGHHVDVGGRTPGSMPPHARDIGEEGFVLRQVQILDQGRFVPPPVLARTLDEGGSRQPQDVQADLEAQVAACGFGATALRALFQEVGPAAFGAQLAHLEDHAEQAVRELLADMPGQWSRRVLLDAGAGDLLPLDVAFHVEGGDGTLTLTAPADPGNLNAPRAVAVASLLYVFRCLVAARSPDPVELPLNDGALRPFTLDIPPGSLFDPVAPRAVAGGNVETSQRLVDALLDGLGALAGSQGTMNNLTVGTAAGAFYETIGGGSGAGPGFPGADGVQVHMTNTRATDVEELEQRFPVRLLHHARRPGSGGKGHWSGGDGVIKQWLLLEPATVSLLAGRRKQAAPGMHGGQPGAVGRDRRLRDGVWSDMPAEWQAQAGDSFCIETPGGGGWGVP